MASHGILPGLFNTASISKDTALASSWLCASVLDAVEVDGGGDEGEGEGR